MSAFTFFYLIVLQFLKVHKAISHTGDAEGDFVF